MTHITSICGGISKHIKPIGINSKMNSLKKFTISRRKNSSKNSPRYNTKKVWTRYSRM